MKTARTKRSSTPSKISIKRARKPPNGSYLEQRRATSATKSTATANVLKKRTGEARKTLEDKPLRPETKSRPIVQYGDDCFSGKLLHRFAELTMAMEDLSFSRELSCR